MGRVLIDQRRFSLILRRLSQQILERHGDLEQSCLIGIQPRGIQVSRKIRALILDECPGLSYDYGHLDITFYRDDFRRRDKPLHPYATDLRFSTENKRVILIDDVLYTGRTIQAALTALNHFGRPQQVELLTLVDRRFNRHLPIRADYTGIQVDAVDEAYVRVDWHNDGREHQIMLFAAKSDQDKQ